MTNDIVVVTEQGNPYALMPVLGLQDAAAVAVAVLIAGLCRAAADVRDVEPDTGEYK